MPRKKKIESEIEEGPVIPEVSLPEEPSEKEKLEYRQKELNFLYEKLKEEGIRSIGDLEVKIAQVNLEISKLN